MPEQPRDAASNLIVQHARITHYLGSHSGKDTYVLELPEGTAHQTGPYTLWTE